MNYQEELKGLFNELKQEEEAQRIALQRQIENLANIRMDLVQENSKLMSTVKEQAQSIESLNNENQELLKISSSLKSSIKALQNQNERLSKLVLQEE